MRDRQTKELVPPGTTHVKYSPGGLIDVEYTVQYLQLIHGHKVPALQTPNTLQALDALQKAELLDKHDAETLHQDYLFLRQLIDALRIVRGNAQDLVLPPSKSDGMIFLARRLGFMTEDWQEGAEALEKEIHRRMKRTHEIFMKRFAQLKK
jgi:glutamate-ammonia-ligase adenylyltransferase